MEASASTWCGLGFVPGAFRIEIVSHLFWSWIQFHPVDSIRFDLSPLIKVFVELHFVLATNRFNESSVFTNRMLVIVFNPDNVLCF